MNLNIATARDLKDPRERRIYRFLEILPGALSWLTLVSAVFFSWYAPFWVAIFILFFDFYWLVRALYSSLYFYSGYRKMEESKNTDWMEKLKSCSEWDKIYHLCLFTLYEEV